MIRYYETKDKQAIESMINSDMKGREMYGCLGYFHMEESPTFWKNIFVYCDENGTIQGIIVGEVISHTRSISIRMLFVNKDARGTGIAKNLIDHLIPFGEAFEVDKLVLNVYSYNNHAIEAYKALGFKECGVQKFHMLYRGQIFDNIQMVKHINLA